jgi:hypothetical protein
MLVTTYHLEKDMAKSAKAPAGAAAGGAGASAPGGSASTGGKMSKTDAVNLALREGITSPSEIASHLKKQYGITISAAHVSNIKSKSKGKPGGNGRRRGRRKGGRPRKVLAAPAEQAAPRPKGSGGLTAEELTVLLAIAKRMGGLGELRSYLDLVGRFQG